MPASRRPSIGEILSNIGPPPRHSPSNTPALSSVRPSFSRGVFMLSALTLQRFIPSTILAAPLPAEFAHQFHCLINHFHSDVERGTETDRILAGTKRQNTEIEEAVPKFFARFRIGEIEREKYPAAPRSGNQSRSISGLQIAQLSEEISTDFAGVLNQTFLLDNAQVMGRAHHVSEVPAPR